MEPGTCVWRVIYIYILPIHVGWCFKSNAKGIASIRSIYFSTGNGLFLFVTCVCWNCLFKEDIALGFDKSNKTTSKTLHICYFRCGIFSSHLNRTTTLQMSESSGNILKQIQANRKSFFFTSIKNKLIVYSS